MWQVQVLSLLFLSATTFGQRDKECCANGTYWLKSTQCSNGTRAQIYCTEGMYLLDPLNNPLDNFTFVNDDLLIVDNSELVPPDRYCLLSEEEALVCHVPGPANSRVNVFNILFIISAIFLIITFAVYVILPELRDLQGKALMCAVFSLGSSYIGLAIMHLAPYEIFVDGVFCLTLAFSLYYCFMSAFLWLNIVAFNVWRSVWFSSFPVPDTVLFVIYSIIAWSGALCFSIAALITHHTEGSHVKPGFGVNSCWFKGHVELWSFFYGPIAVLLTLNLIYFGLTCWKLWHGYNDCGGSNLRALRFKCKLYLKLFLVMGISWIFEVISYATGSSQYWIVTDILNTLQGLIIFVLLIATRKRVKRLLARKRPCGFNFPKSWMAGDDEECECALAEEAELSQTIA